MATLNNNWQLLKEVGFTVFGNNALRLYGKLNSQDTAGNKSNVSFQLRQIAYTGNFYDTGNYASLWCAGADRGTQYFNSNVNTSSEQTIGTWTFDLWHDSQGNCSTSVAGSANVFGNITPGTGDVWFNLPSIAREATLTSTADLTLKGEETKQSLTFNNPGNFWIRLEYIWDNTIKISKNIGQGTSHQITFTQDELLLLYKRQNYVLRTVTHSNSSYNAMVGYKDSNGNISKEGIIRLKKGTDWKEAVPFVYTNGKCNIATLNLYKSEWKRGK